MAGGSIRAPNTPGKADDETSEIRASRSGRPAPPRFPLWLDGIAVIALTVLTKLLCDYYNLAEAIRRFTQRYESIQLDETPLVLLVAAVGLAWFGWRRYRELQAELGRRMALEASLQASLDDNRRLARHAMDTQEAERRRLARELHDELSQYLNAIQIDATDLCAPTLLPRVRDHARSILASAEHVHRSVQTLIRQFRPVALDELGLGAALEHLVADWRHRHPRLQLSLAVDGNIEGADESVNLAVFRLVQEGLTNASRHAQARHIDIGIRGTVLDTGNGNMHVRVVDDGAGTDLRQPTHGLGLVGMRERIEMLAGQLELKSAPRRGFTIDAHLPRRAREPA